LTIRKHDLCGYEIVQSESKPTDQRSVAAAQRQASHADRSDRSGDSGETKGLRRSRKIKSARASRNLRFLLRGDGDAVHSAHVDNDAIAQSATCPIMASAAHRHGKVAIAGGADGRLHVFDRTAMNDGARSSASLRPNGCCIGVANLARRRHLAAQPVTEAIEGFVDAHVFVLLSNTRRV
jgi:hypothetical protein